MRSTTPSPKSMGMTETRRSYSRPWWRIEIRPSCGLRFSAMLRFAMIFSRLTMALRNRFTVAGTPAWLSTPSMR
jgi:hypothetical protein